MTEPAAPQREQTPSNSLALEAVRRNPIVRIVLVVLPAIVSSLAAYTGATGDARGGAQVVKDKAESGYQVTRRAVAELQERVAELEEEVAQLRRAARSSTTRKPTKASAPAPAPAAPSSPPPAPLPPTLDKALEQQQPPAPEPPKP